MSPCQYSNDLQSLEEWYDGLLSVDNRFHVFVSSSSQSKTTSGIILHVLPSISKVSIPPIHISTIHGSPTISLINQFNCFHSTLPVLTQNLIATYCSSMMPMTRHKIFTCKTSSYSQTERKLLKPGHVLHEA